jgi:hypothetical protein
MKTEQELLERFKEINKLLQSYTNPRDYRRRMLLKEYNVLHWVLFE